MWHEMATACRTRETAALNPSPHTKGRTVAVSTKQSRAEAAADIPVRPGWNYPCRPAAALWISQSDNPNTHQRLAGDGEPNPVPEGKRTIGLRCATSLHQCNPRNPWSLLCLVTRKASSLAASPAPLVPAGRLKWGVGGGNGSACNAGALRPFGSRRFDKGGPQTTQTDAEPAGTKLRLSRQPPLSSQFDPGWRGWHGWERAGFRWLAAPRTASRNATTLKGGSAPDRQQRPGGARHRL